MCKCLTSFDIINMLNDKRRKVGMNEVSYDWMMCQHRWRIRFFQPVRKIGTSLVWDLATAKKIVNTLYKIPYTLNRETIEVMERLKQPA